VFPRMRLTTLHLYFFVTLLRCKTLGAFRSARSLLPKFPQKCSSQRTSLFSHSELKITDDMSGISKPVPLLPCGDILDRQIFALAFPAIINFAVVPLVGAVDMFFIGRMNNALALAGSAAANQIFGSIYWTCSFLPLVVSPMVAAATAINDEKLVRSRITDALKIAMVIGILGTVGISLYADKLLNLVLPAASASREFAEPYLRIRAATFLPAIMSTVGFAAFRGKMDVTTPLKISLLSNIVNAALDPIFIFVLKMGVSGAALATSVSDFLGFCIYMKILVSRGFVKPSDLFRKSSGFVKNIRPLLAGGVTLQFRSLLIEVIGLILLSFLSLQTLISSIAPFS